MLQNRCDFTLMVTPRDGLANGSETRDPSDRLREQDGSRRGRICPRFTHPGASLGCGSPSPAGRSATVVKSVDVTTIFHREELQEGVGELCNFWWCSRKAVSVSGRTKTSYVLRTCVMYGYPIVEFCRRSFYNNFPYSYPLLSLLPRICLLFRGLFLSCAPPVQMPVGSGTEFIGAVDLVTMTAVLYQAGRDGLSRVRASSR